MARGRSPRPPSKPAASPNRAAASRSSPQSSTAKPSARQPVSDLPVLHSIRLNDSPLARSYTHIHTLLLLSVFYFSFSQLVADPVTTLTRLTGPLIVLQSVYVAVCLPLAGSEASMSKDSKGSTRSKKASTSSSTAGSASTASKITHLLLTHILSLTSGVPLFYALLLLHGAPFLTHIPHTLLLATHLALLSTPALFYTRGVDAAVWRTLVSFEFLFHPNRSGSTAVKAHPTSVTSPQLQDESSTYMPELDVVLRGADKLTSKIGETARRLGVRDSGRTGGADETTLAAVGALVGAWLGAVPIPLDWDRDWQRWPVTVVTGAYMGWAAGRAGAWALERWRERGRTIDS